MVSPPNTVLFIYSYCYSNSLSLTPHFSPSTIPNDRKSAFSERRRKRCAASKTVLTKKRRNHTREQAHYVRVSIVLLFTHCILILPALFACHGIYTAKGGNIDRRRAPELLLSLNLRGGAGRYGEPHPQSSNVPASRSCLVLLLLIVLTVRINIAIPTLMMFIIIIVIIIVIILSINSNDIQ